MKGKFSMFLLILILCGWQATQTVVEAANHLFAEAHLQKDPPSKIGERPPQKTPPKNSPTGAKSSPTKTPLPRSSNLTVDAPSGQVNSDEDSQQPTKTSSETHVTNEDETKVGRQNPEKKSKTDAADSDSWFTLPSWAFPALAGVMLLGGAAALLWYLFRRVEQRRIALANTVNLMQQKHETLNKNFEKLKSEAVALANQVGEQKLQINALKHNPPTAPAVQPKSNYINNSQDNRSTAAAIGTDFNKPIQPDPIFPVSVDDYLKNVGRGIAVKYDYKTDLLTENHDGESSLVVVRDDTIPGSLHYVVPRFGIFQTGNDFIHVKNYYNCLNPTGGTIWIKEPAVVERAEGGWRLALQGELEVK